MIKPSNLTIALGLQKQDLLDQTLHKILHYGLASCSRELKRIKELNLDDVLINKVLKKDSTKVKELIFYLGGLK